jgi:hypothetical protein
MSRWPAASFWAEARRLVAGALVAAAVADWLTRLREAAAEEGRAGLRGVLRGRAEAGMGEENNSD